MPGSLAVLLCLVCSDVAKLDQELSEGHLLLRRFLRIKNGGRWPAQILSERPFHSDLAFRLQVVCVLVLWLTQGALQCIAARHPVVDVLHVAWQLVHRTLFILCHLGWEEHLVGYARHLPFKVKDRWLNLCFGCRQILCLLHSLHYRKLAFSWSTELQYSLFLFPDIVDLIVTKAGLAHGDFLHVSPSNLFAEVPLGHMLVSCDRLREMIQILEAMLVSLVQWELGSLHLKIKVNETSWTRLQLRRMEGIHCCEVAATKTVVITNILRPRTFSNVNCSVTYSLFVLVLHREVITIFPDFCQCLGATVWTMDVFQVSMWARCELTLTNNGSVNWF